MRLCSRGRLSRIVARPSAILTTGAVDTPMGDAPLSSADPRLLPDLRAPCDGNRGSSSRWSAAHREPAMPARVAKGMKAIFVLARFGAVARGRAAWRGADPRRLGDRRPTPGPSLGGGQVGTGAGDAAEARSNRRAKGGGLPAAGANSGTISTGTAIVPSAAVPAGQAERPGQRRRPPAAPLRAAQPGAGGQQCRQSRPGRRD